MLTFRITYIVAYFVLIFIGIPETFIGSVRRTWRNSNIIRDQRNLFKKFNERVRIENFKVD